MLIVGRHQPELKYAYTTSFTNSYFENKDSYLADKLSPRFLVGTSGCIGAGLDCSSVHIVCRSGLPSNIITFIQEMGRCGRGHNIHSSPNIYSIIFTMNDYIYLIERIYTTDESSSSSQSDCDSENNSNVISKEQEREMAVSSLNNLCRMIFLSYGCWHAYLEWYSSNPFAPRTFNHFDHCNKMCPHCDGSISSIIKPISRSGMSLFLLKTMIEEKTTNITPSQLAKKLNDYPLVGRCIYGRHSATKPERSSDTYVTVLQLIASNILHIRVEPAKKPIAYIYLSCTEHTPNYLLSDYWTYIRQI